MNDEQGPPPPLPPSSSWLAMSRSLGLEQLGVKADDFNLLAENALKDACGFTNPKQASHEEIVAIFRTAM